MDMTVISIIILLLWGYAEVVHWIADRLAAREVEEYDDE